MSATVYYDNANKLATITASFVNTAGVATDPTTITCVVTEPAGVQVVHSYLGTAPADITRLGVGNYQLLVPCSPSVTGVDGLWSFAFIGAGTVQDVQPGTWRVLPLPLGNFYCGLEELKDRIGMTDHTDDSSAQMAIQAASGWINEYCAQHFYRITETRTFRPQNLWKLSIDPVITVTALNVDTTGNGTFDQAWVQGTDYQLIVGHDTYNVNAAGVPRPYRTVQVLQAGKWFPFTWPYSHLDRIQITGTWGWPAVPPAVSQACVVLAEQFFKEKDAPFGVAGEADFGTVKSQTNPWVAELLRPYIYSRRKVGC